MGLIISNTGSKEEFFKLTAFTTLGVSATLFNAANQYSDPFNGKPKNGINAGYLNNFWIINGVNNYEVLCRFSKKEKLSSFIYSGDAQFTTYDILTCEIWAITDEADVPTNYALLSTKTNLTKVWDNDAGTDPAFSSSITSDAWDYRTSRKFDLQTPIECYGVVFVPKTNGGSGTRTQIYKLLFQ